MSNPLLQIENRKIGLDHTPLIIAEIGINHGGSLNVAKKMVDAAVESGAEIIKHQTHIAAEEMSDEAKKVIPTHTKNSIFEIIENCQLNESDEFELMKYVQSKNKIFISTPFSRKAVDRLIEFDVPAIKIGSGECNNLPLIDYISRKNKPLILSTGMNSLSSIGKTTKILDDNKCKYALLHCTNVYPTPPHLVRLDCLKILKDKYPNNVFGLSDHTTSNFTSLGAIALGASIIERHFTDSKDRVGPDISCSMDPKELKELIKGSEILFKARGSNKDPVKEEFDTLAFANASVVAIDFIEKGNELSLENIWVKRPGNGDFLAKDFNNLLGKKAKVNISSGNQIKKEHIN